MTARHVTNIAASVRQRLLNKAREDNRPFNELLQHYAMERFLFRLSMSEHRDRFILKGALLLRAWQAPFLRPTMDIDMLGRTDNSPDTLVPMVRAICSQTVEDDGLLFDTESVAATTIAEDAHYTSVRLQFRGQLGTARIRIQVDVGFGDVITPEPSPVDYPPLLGLPAPRLLAYPRETVVAEKFQVMLHRGLLNSRLRDYYDIWLLSRSFSFDGPLLAEAIRNTCAYRETPIPEQPTGLSAAFTTDTARETQWNAFLRKSQLTNAPVDLAILVQDVRTFLGPLAQALGADMSFPYQWDPPGPWRHV